MNFLKILLICIALFAGIKLYAQKKQAVEIISPKEFNRIAEKDPRAVIIDLRNSKAYKKGHIMYALLAEKSEKLFEIIDTTGTDQKYLLYCKYGDRSVDAGKILFKKYQITSYSLNGGTDLWKKQGFKLVK